MKRGAISARSNYARTGPVQKKIEDELREAKTRADMYLDLLSHDIRNMDQISIGYLEVAMNKLDTGENLTKADRGFIRETVKRVTQLGRTHQYRNESEKSKIGQAAHGKNRPG